MTKVIFFEYNLLDIKKQQQLAYKKDLDLQMKEKKERYLHFIFTLTLKDNKSTNSSQKDS